jgi:hypothetical protein
MPQMQHVVDSHLSPQATFSLPANIRSTPWLYSGFIDLLPSHKTGNKTVIWAPEDRWKPWWKFNMKTSPLPGPRFLTIPYQVGGWDSTTDLEESRRTLLCCGITTAHHSNDGVTETSINMNLNVGQLGIRSNFVMHGTGPGGRAAAVTTPIKV